MLVNKVFRKLSDEKQHTILRGKKVLLVDDEPGVRNIFHLFLELKDAVVFEAKNGQEALDIYNNDVPDVIVLNLIMGGMTGWDVANYIRLNKKDDNTPIIFYTGQDDVHAFRESALSGGNLYYTKPQDPKVIIQAIAVCLDKDSLASIPKSPPGKIGYFYREEYVLIDKENTSPPETEPTTNRLSSFMNRILSIYQPILSCINRIRKC